MRSSDLAVVPFAQLLVELHETRETGTVLIHSRRTSDGKLLRAATYFAKGEPLAVLAEGCDARGVRPVLVAFCGLSKGRFEFVEEHDLVGDRGARAASPVDPIEVVAAAMRELDAALPIKRALRAIGPNQVRLHPRTQLSRYAFSEEEQKVADALMTGPMDLSELRRRTGLPDTLLLPTFTALWLTRALTALPEQRRTTSGTVQLDLPAREIARRLSLRPPVRSTIPAPRRASSLPPFDRPPRASMRVPAQPAPQELPSAPPRSEHSTLPPLSDARSQQKLMRAAWGNIEVMTQRRQYDAALQAALEALKAGEALPEHQALLAWIIYQHSGAGSEVHPKVWRLFDRALRRDPLCEKALYYKALVLKRIGHAEQACAHFERLLLTNPTHIDAVREVRLHKMRNRQPSGLRRLLPK